MKTKTIILIIASCISIASCTNKQKQQNTIIGGADSTTDIVIADEDGNKQDSDTVIYELPECSLWYIKELTKDYKDKEIRMWTECKEYQEDVQVVNVFVVNPTDAWWFFGRSWYLEVWNGEKWVYPEFKRDLFWFDDGFAIEKAPLLYCFRFPVGRHFYLSEGKYRIKKGFSMNKGKSSYTELTAEFYIK